MNEFIIIIKSTAIKDISYKVNSSFMFKLTYLLYITLLTNITKCCFVVHYVVYFEKIPMRFYLQMSQNSSFPYIVHLNEPFNLPDNRTFKREINPVEKSDIKKVEIVYHHGGLYIDNDQFIDYQCIKEHVCNLEGLYFLDWTHLVFWRSRVPLSWIYASHRGSKILQKSLRDLDQSNRDIVSFSGPQHMQKYRKYINLVKIPKECEYHRADMTWYLNKQPERVQNETKKYDMFIKNFNEEQMKSIDIFTKLWQTNTVIYPKDFNISIQNRVQLEFNHIQMGNQTYCIIERVIKFSTVPETRKKLEDFLQEHQPEVLLRGEDKDLQIRQQNFTTLENEDISFDDQQAPLPYFLQKLKTNPFFGFLISKGIQYYEYVLVGLVILSLAGLIICFKKIKKFKNEVKLHKQIPNSQEKQNTTSSPTNEVIESIDNFNKSQQKENEEEEKSKEQL